MPASVKQFSILIVEDEQTQALVIETLLKSENYKTYFATNGKEAIELATQHKPDLILCDWMMPEMSGIEVCKNIKNNPIFTSTIFILLTGKNAVEDQVYALESGADDFLNKPIEKNQLIARIRAGLRQHQLYQKLQTINQELKETQAQLIQAKKMSGLEKIAAGIAHEINNPMNFIYGNLGHAKNYFIDLIRLIKLYQNNCSENVPEIEDFKEEIDFNYLIQDLPKLLDSMRNGSIRVKEITTSLRTFAGLDEADFKPTEINQCLDVTLKLMEQELQSKNIKIIRQYANLPLINSNQREINQVFMNILSNAIDAIEIKKRKNIAAEFSGTITICTKNISHNSVISISIFDNGTGIPEDAFEHIFDPFFTTKTVGDGIGIGLSVTHQIIHQHRGQIFCNSYPDIGAEFVINLPVDFQ